VGASLNTGDSRGLGFGVGSGHFPLRFLLYSHDALGLGHVRRNLQIARALAELAPRSSVLLATSASEVDRLGIPSNVEVLKLPGLHKLGNQRYAPRRQAISHPQVIELRAALWSAAVESFRPHVALVDKHPLGVDGELRAGLELLDLAGGYAVLGLRDILDEPEHVVREWASEHAFQAIEDHYERVLVYGSPAVFDPVREYRIPSHLAERVLFCGYVSNLPAWDRPVRMRRVGRSRRPRILVTVGGGEDGFPILESSIRAAKKGGWAATAVTGPYASETQREWLRLLAGGNGVSVRTFMRDLPARFDQIDALICMGGYNTLIEALARATPTVTVPRIQPRSEQLMRARAFGELGLLRVVIPTGLHPDRLVRAVEEAMTIRRSDLVQKVRAVLDLDGATRAAEQLVDLASRSERRQRQRSGTPAR
jgi:predicted glycosyltransferase